jgi:hypothetical protein
MNELEQVHKAHAGANRENARRPYWTRAHRDWRVWVGVAVMLTALAIYLMSFDLALRPRTQPQPPLSGTVAK